jgi:hypothetical protein
VSGSSDISTLSVLVPNPTEGSLRLSIDNEENVGSIYTLVIHDLSGHVLMEREDVRNGDLLHVELPSGLYIASLKSDNEQFTQKILIR